MNIDVIFANRRNGVFWSIEELFSVVKVAFPEWVKVRTVNAPSERANLNSLIQNLWWAYTLKDYDLIHHTGAIPYVVLAIWPGPVVVTIHDLRIIEETHGIKRFLYSLCWHYLPCLRAARVTVISEFTKERLVALCRVNPAKVRVIPNCVAPEFIAQPRPWPVVTGVSGSRTQLRQTMVRLLQVGTTDNKNLQRVAEACSGLPVQLVILGKLSKSQCDYLVQHGVEYENQFDLSKDSVVALYAACDLICFVSTYEGFGMPILEGQAVGRPVLTSDLSPMKEVAGKGALKVDPFAVAAIRFGLMSLLSDSELREGLVRKGYENVQNYSAQAVASQYAELYRDVLRTG